MQDDLGAPVDLATPPRRVVSLVPSLTETLAATAPGLLVAATDWCTRPADLDVPR
ncbi:MAG: cobalamin-binding protein, partial [Micrococcales bacterium]